MNRNDEKAQNYLKSLPIEVQERMDKVYKTLQIESLFPEATKEQLDIMKIIPFSKDQLRQIEEHIKNKDYYFIPFICEIIHWKRTRPLAKKLIDILQRNYWEEQILTRGNIKDFAEGIKSRVIECESLERAYEQQGYDKVTIDADLIPHSLIAGYNNISRREIFQEIGILQERDTPEMTLDNGRLPEALDTPEINKIFDKYIEEYGQGGKLPETFAYTVEYEDLKTELKEEFERALEEDDKDLLF